MVIRVIGFPRSPLDDDTFPAAIPPGPLRVDVILPILSARKPPFTILENPSAHIAGGRLAVPILDRLQNVMCLRRRLGQRGRNMGLHRAGDAPRCKDRRNVSYRLPIARLRWKNTFSGNPRADI